MVAAGPTVYSASMASLHTPTRLFAECECERAARGDRVVGGLEA
jgi:hypothetical protein